MTALTPPPGVEAHDHQIPGCVLDWAIPSPEGGRLRIRLRNGQVVLRTAPLGTLTLGGDPAEIRRFAWQQLAALHRLARVIELGMPEPEPDPQTTVDEHLAEAGLDLTIRTGVPR